MFIDFGFKQEVESFGDELMLRIPNLSSLTKRCNYIQKYSFVNFNVVVLQSFFLNEVLVKKNKALINFKLLFFFFLAQKRKIKDCIQGRFLNMVRGGFSVGICGYIAFLPRSQALLKYFGKVSLFYILFVNVEKKTLVVSQKKIDKIVRRRLLKLGSRLVYLKKK